MSPETGDNWEFHSLWVGFLYIVLNCTAAISFAIHFGQDMQNPTTDVALILVPGFGADFHLAKAFTFVALNAYCSRCSGAPGNSPPNDLVENVRSERSSVFPDYVFWVLVFFL